MARPHTAGFCIPTSPRDPGRVEADRYRAWLATQLPNGTHHIAGLKVFVQTSRRFDATYAAKILPAEWIERVSRPVVDRALAEALLPPDLYRTCQIEGKRSVRLT